MRLITVSDRAHSGERDDRSGPAASETLTESGIVVAGSTVIPDGRDAVRVAIEEAISHGDDVVITLGGTGVGPRDETPEGTRPLIDSELPGIMEALRAGGAEKVPTAVLSRGLAGVTAPATDGHGVVLINLPGSVGGARDGARYLAGILPHLVSQLRGGDH